MSAQPPSKSVAYLEGAYAQVADRLNSMDRAIEALRAELRAEINALRAEINALRAEINALRAEMNARFAQMDQKLMWMFGLQVTVLLAILPLYFRH